MLPDWKTQCCDGVIFSKMNLIASVYSKVSMGFLVEVDKYSKSYVEKQRNYNCLYNSEKEQSWVTYFRFQAFL